MTTRITAPELLRMKQNGERIAAITAYDFTFARLVERGGVHVVLVGDSLGNVIQGRESTLPVTLDEMIYHTRAVARGLTRALLVTDLPFMSYQPGPQEALLAAGRVLKESEAQAVKLEGGVSQREAIAALTAAGIPVMGHVGLTPQSVHHFGGYRVQGREPESADRVFADARAVEEAGAFAVVLEGIPADLATRITAALTIPTIGIGAGAGCSGQVLVVHDLLGLNVEPTIAPKFVKRYANLQEEVIRAVREYVEEVGAGSFPGPEHSYGKSKG